MVVDQYDHYRPFPSYGLGGGDGPTRYNNRCISNDIYDVVVAGGGGAAANGGAADGLRTLQPFDISPAETITAFKSPGGIAATMGFPFTNAQWKELERQTMIYKYMMASVPVPPHLLFPTPRNLNSDPVARHSSLGTGLNLKFTNGADLEPGRCRRTDGKKWRCSRDVARDQKYCERHMHRGRPRSRKPVELQANTDTNNNNKKTRYNPAVSAESPVPAVASQFVGTNSQPYLQAPVFPDKPSEKVANFDASLAFAAAFKEEPRSLEWMIKGEPADQQWHHMIKQTEIGLSNERSFNSTPILNPDYHGGEALNLNSFGNFSAGEDHHSNQCTLFLNETPRGFIDAWSNGASDDQSGAASRNTGSAVSSNGKLSQSSLSLSMGGINMDDEMDQIQMGLGLIESDQNRECCTKSLAMSSASWTGATPGGPLAEVIQLSSANATASQSSPVAENGDSGSPPATAVSSPSGFPQKTLASFSDSSSNSSPTLASTARAKS
uniref:Growth-regulating factor n=1 Tax=Hevea brasiliensis TaxID=3981 RepID=A0A6M3YBY1_HEVBR|nr:growth-regulating factor 3 [Hevea brasiliensis]